MRIDTGTPLVIAPSGAAATIGRVAFEDKVVMEESIQSLIHDFPRVLPVAEIREEFAPLIPIGREVSVPAGNIDNLFISPSGNITVVEAKLWRNPQARREVVGQIIDYAKDLATWSYDDLDEACRLLQGKSLWQVVTDTTDNVREADFIGNVQQNLRDGRFLLLIVGDGIREEVERMAAFLQGTPTLHFHLALIELRMYSSPDNLRVIVPSVVARTNEIERAIVRVEVAPEATVAVSVVVPSDDSPSTHQKLTEDVFIAQFPDRYRSAVEQLFADAKVAGLVVYLGSTGCSLRMPIPGASQPLSVAWLFPPGIVGWMGMSELTLGFDLAGASERFGGAYPPALDVFDTSAGALAGATPATGKGMKIHRVPLDAFQSNVEQIVALLVDLRRELSGDE